MIRAMIVDDEALVRKGLRLLFPWEKYGIEITHEASRADRAIELLEKEQCDLVFTDISMPDMNGLTFMSKVRESMPNIHFVVLTCHQDFDYIQQSLRLGAIDYIVKTQLEEQNPEIILERIVIRISASRDDTQLQLFGDSYLPFKGVAWMVDDQSYNYLKISFPSAKISIEGIRLLTLEWQQRMPNIDWEQLKQWLEHQDRHAESILNAVRNHTLAALRPTGQSEDIILLILKVVDDIYDHPNVKKSQEQISKDFGISRSYFSKCFKQVTGVSFVYYLQQANIAYAKNLLITTNKPIYWVSQQAGFQDDKYFSKVFRTMTGKLPTHYRNEMRIGES